MFTGVPLTAKVESRNVLVCCCPFKEAVHTVVLQIPKAHENNVNAAVNKL